MNKRWATVTIIILLLILIGYIVIDTALKKETVQSSSPELAVTGNADQWIVVNVFQPGKGQLNAVAVSADNHIFLGGEPFIACYDSAFKLLWEYETGMSVSALAVSGERVYAAVHGIILVLNKKGEKLEEWGPFENNSIITSLSANETYVAFADAANRTIFILDKEGVAEKLIGKSEEPFVIPSFYFDIALGSDNKIYVANTGNKRIETRNMDGKILSFFGESGTGPESFCGCCNPAHFAIIPGGFITAEKGINRIKILDNNGEFVESVSSVNDFVPPLPIDIASPDGEIIYGANPADSKLYVFRRRVTPTPLKGS
jgi:hypothetical protein